MLADGTKVDPEFVLGPLERGTKLVVVVDAEGIESLQEHVLNADLLIIEATFLERDAAMARDYDHLTAAKAAELAAGSTSLTGSLDTSIRLSLRITTKRR